MTRHNPTMSAAIVNALEFHVALAAGDGPHESSEEFYQNLDELSGLTAEQWQIVSAEYSFAQGVIAGALIGAAIARYRLGTDLGDIARSAITEQTASLRDSANRDLEMESNPVWLVRHIEEQIAALPALIQRAREGIEKQKQAEVDAPEVDAPATRVIPDLDAIAKALWPDGR